MVKFTDDMKTSGFELIPEGVTILKVEELKPVQNMGKIREYKARFCDSKGRKLFNNYNVSPTNKYYTQAMRSFYSLLNKGCALTEDASGEINEEEAVGRYIIARIKHTEGNDGRIFQNLGYVIGNASSFDDDISQWRDDVPAKVANDEVEDDPYL